MRAAYETLQTERILPVGEELDGVSIWMRDLAAGERTLVCVFREGMWITSHAPQLQNTHFANLAPFCAVVNVEDPSAGSDENSICALVREAEGETHSQIRPSEITDPDKKKSLEEALKRIADVLRAEGKPSVGQVVEPDQLRIFRGRLLTPAPAPPVRREETDDPPEEVTDTDTDTDTETLHTVMQTSTMPITTISLAPRDVGTGTVHLWPGVVTVSECSLDPTGTPWGTGPITLRRGRYLVRGAPMRVEHRGSDPMLFIADPDMEPETAVSIRVEEIGQDSRFVVRARPDRIDRLKYDEPALMSCWATALALLPVHSVFKIEENDAGEATVPGSLIGDLILRRLQADRPDIDLWDNETAWDPMRAASAFVHLSPRPADSEPE